jgi:hypothetical protein
MVSFDFSRLLTKNSYLFIFGRDKTAVRLQRLIPKGGKIMQKQLLIGAAAVGALGYPLLELLWRGRTHISMSLAGAICAAAIWLLSDRCRRGFFWLRVLSAAAIITLVELAFGVVCNLMLKLGVWDYGGMSMNFLGQICLPYFFVWIVLSIPVCLLFTQISDAFRS